MGLLGSLGDLVAEVVNTGTKVVEGVVVPVREVAEEVVRTTTEVIKDVKDEIID